MRPDFLALCPMKILTDSHLSVILEHRLRDILEHLEPIPHRLWLVVISLNQRLTSFIINTINFGWVEYKVVHAPADNENNCVMYIHGVDILKRLPGGVNPSVLDSFDYCLKRDTEIDNDINRCLLLQCLCLSNSP